MDFASTQKQNNMQHYLFLFFKLNKFVIQITILSF